MIKNSVCALMLLCMSLLVGCQRPSVQALSIPAQTQMSRAITLDAVPDSAKTVYFKLQNETELSSSYMIAQIRRRLQSQGFKFESNPQYAHYVLNVDVKRVVRVNQDIALAIGASPYNVSLATVPLDPKGKDGFYTGVADIKLVEKAAYAPGGRRVYCSRLVAYPQQQNIDFLFLQNLLLEHTLGMARGLHTCRNQ